MILFASGNHYHGGMAERHTGSHGIKQIVAGVVAAPLVSACGTMEPEAPVKDVSAKLHSEWLPPFESLTRGANRF
jgi:uncharacterized lipoprotein